MARPRADPDGRTRTISSPKWRSSGRSGTWPLRRRLPRARCCWRVEADDFVMGFQYEEDARRMLLDLKERLAKFKLTLHEKKTRLIEFGRFPALRRQKRGERRPETFAFLGFTHYC